MRRESIALAAHFQPQAMEPAMNEDRTQYWGECPVCGAKAGEPCVARRGRTAGKPLKGDTVHAGRKVAPE